MLTQSHLSHKNKIHTRYKAHPKKTHHTIKRAFSLAELYTIIKNESENNRTEHISFPDTTNENVPMWRIRGVLDPRGYYTESTSHVLNEECTWVSVTEKECELFLPTAVTSNEFIVIDRRIPLVDSQKTVFKIPIKDGTMLGALQIVGNTDNSVAYRVFLLKDGTVEVIIDDTTHSWVDVYAQLIATDNSQVKAVQKLHPLNEKRLGESAKQLLDIARDFNNKESDTFEKIITRLVHLRHTFSINPDDKEKLEEAYTPEEIVSIISNYSGVTSSIANAESILLSSANNQHDYFLNQATGFIVNVVTNPESGKSNGYLLSQAKHSYGIDSKGDIFDATPSKIADETVTKQYVESLQRVPAEQWDIIQERISKDALFQKNNAEKNVHDLQHGTTKETIDDMVLAAFNGYELQDAFNFFTWLSWRRGRDLGEPIQVSKRHKRAVLNTLRESIQEERLLVYLQKPRRFETIAHISRREAAKMRFLARYLLS